MTIGTRIIRAPRGSALSCKGWPQEAALRMLMNNLDPDVAERPDDLVVYGGSGKAARNWESFDAIVEALRALDEDRSSSNDLATITEAIASGQVERACAMKVK